MKLSVTRQVACSFRSATREPNDFSRGAARHKCDGVSPRLQWHLLPGLFTHVHGQAIEYRWRKNVAVGSLPGCDMNLCDVQSIVHRRRSDVSFVERHLSHLLDTIVSSISRDFAHRVA